MVIAFKDNMGCIIAMYPIYSISMESDKKGEPVDIVIKAEDWVLEGIAEKYCILGFNNEHDKEALYGRLQSFVVLPFYKENPELETLTIDW